jgi:hypothetical protein
MLMWSLTRPATTIAAVPDFTTLPRTPSACGDQSLCPRATYSPLALSVRTILSLILPPLVCPLIAIDASSNF